MLASQRLKDAATHRPGLGLGLGERGTERADRTTEAAVRVAGVIDHEIAPLP